jgi:uncharacterized glyoxalase superfamily protein PhnB
MPGARIITGLRYTDAKAAIDWLREAFGFEPHLVVEGDGDTVVHAQLKLGEHDMIMLGSVRGDGDPFSKYYATPGDIDGRNTMACIVVIDDVQAHHDRAVAAGARVVYPVTEQEYGGSAYSCLDPEGFIWHFGSYNPWQ